MINHTFLLNEGIWKGEGYYSDKEDNMIPMRGETIVTHLDNLWVIESKMILRKSEPEEIINKYQIKPFKEGAVLTTWESYNQSLGKLTGNFVIQDQYIISIYDSKESSGTEYLQKIDGEHYKNRGLFYMGQQRVASWSMDLILQKKIVELMH